jgi:hypothetical protein
MLHKFIALARGWREATDYDESPPLLVVYHPTLGVHFSGANAWRDAAEYGRA